jgi:prolipoprotein diacylglyceryl transferase
MTTLNFIHWNFNPTAFHIFGLEVRWYGILFACVFLFGFYMVKWMLKKEGKPLKIADSLLYALLIGVVVGARLAHCLFYEPDYFLAHPLKIITGFRDGGLASHGGAIGIIIALIYVTYRYRKEKITFWYLIDRVAIIAAFSGMLIRLGNLCNSEIYGVQTTLPWGFIFERNGETLPKHPTQLYEALGYLALFIILFIYYLKKDKKPKEGIVIGSFLIGCFGIIRFFVEFVKEVQEPWEKGMLLNMGQLLSLPFLIIGVIVLILGIKGKLPFSNKEKLKQGIKK